MAKSQAFTEKELERKLKNFETYLLLECSLSPTTRELYTKIMTRILRQAKTLKPSKYQLVNFFLDLHRSKKSSTHIRNTQLAAENYTAFCGKKIEFTRPKKQPRPIRNCLSDAEVAVLIAASKDIREKAMVSILASTGIRNAELCGLRVGDIDIAHQLIQVEGKGGRVTMRGIDGDCIAVILKYLQAYPRGDGDFLFTVLRTNEQYKPWDVRRLIKRLAKRARIERRVFPHLLRHSYATSLLRHGADIRSVQWQLAHLHLETTMIYVHSDPKMAQRVIARCQPAYL